MAKATITVLFDGLWLFCKPQENLRYCETGPQTKAPEHSINIRIFDADGKELPLKDHRWLPKRQFSHAEIRKHEILYLFVGDPASMPPTPEANAIQVQEEFNNLLDLQSCDFYDGPDDVLDRASRHYQPSVFITTGILSAASERDNYKFSRVDQKTIDHLGLFRNRASQVDVKEWQRIKQDRNAVKPLPAFAKIATVDVAIGEEEFLVLKGPNGEIFHLPHPTRIDPGLKTYNVQIDNLDIHDRRRRSDRDINCRAFYHHTVTFSHTGKPNYGLYPTILPHEKNDPPHPDENKERDFRKFATDDACCDCSRGSKTSTLLPDNRPPFQ